MVKTTKYHKKFLMCVMCGKGLWNKRHLESHIISTHTREKAFECRICGRSFGGLYNLRIHRRCHAEVKPFTCDVCGNGARTLGNLKHHMLIHSLAKPQTCIFCHKKFRHHGALWYHLRKHIGEPPFACNNCGFASNTKALLNVHVQQNPQCRPKSTHLSANSTSGSANFKATTVPGEGKISPSSSRTAHSKVSAIKKTPITGTTGPSSCGSQLPNLELEHGGGDTLPEAETRRQDPFSRRHVVNMFRGKGTREMRLDHELVASLSRAGPTQGNKSHRHTDKLCHFVCDNCGCAYRQKAALNIHWQRSPACRPRSMPQLSAFWDTGAEEETSCTLTTRTTHFNVSANEKTPIRAATPRASSTRSPPRPLSNSERNLGVDTLLDADEAQHEPSFSGCHIVNIFSDTGEVVLLDQKLGTSSHPPHHNDRDSSSGVFANSEGRRCRFVLHERTGLVRVPNQAPTTVAFPFSSNTGTEGHPEPPQLTSVDRTREDGFNGGEETPSRQRDRECRHICSECNAEFKDRDDFRQHNVLHSAITLLSNGVPGDVVLSVLRSSTANKDNRGSGN